MSTILMYHYLGAAPTDAGRHAPLYVPEADFTAQLRHLSRSAIKTVSPQEYDAGLSLGALAKTAWLTFDDGRLDNYTIALPALLKAKQRATFFVIAQRALSAEPGYMNLAMLREAIDAGMSIGSHSLTHPRLARLTANELRREVFDSKARLEDALGVEVTSFCYPYGNFDAQVLELVNEAGYRLAVSTIRDNVNSGADRFRLKRVMVQPGRTGASFRYLFSSLYHWVHARKNRNRWKAKHRSAP
ncbi:polysaccharide deacetylase family protein [Candidatus Sumerlaeota bacterium]|nr:polysaccharide deacetylase family protein [Candidatus Sumerlaeota bacterium]